MSSNKNLVDEYFDPKTSLERREEIMDQIAGLPENDRTRVAVELGEAVAVAERIGNFTHRVKRAGSASKKSPITLKIAASVAFLGITSALIFRLFFYSPTGNDDLFTTYFEPYPDLISSRDMSDSLTSVAISFYNKNEFQKAANTFDLIPQKGNLIRLYAGIANMALGNLNNAKIELKQIDNSDEGVSIVAKWYLSLIHLKNNETSEAKKLWEQLKSSGYKESEIRELLQLSR